MNGYISTFVSLYSPRIHTSKLRISIKPRIRALYTQKITNELPIIYRVLEGVDYSNAANEKKAQHDLLRNCATNVSC